MIFTILLAFVALILLYNVYVRFNRAGRMTGQLPGPFAYPVIGNILMAQTSQEGQFTLLRETNDLYYPIYRFWAGMKCDVNMRHPDDVEILLSSRQHIEKGELYKFVKTWLSTGLLTSGGTKWYNRRKILTPAFHFNILKHFVDTLTEESQYFVESLMKQGDGKPLVIDVLDTVGQHTLNAICETAMGISLKGKNSIQTDYRESVKIASESITYRIVRPWYYPNFTFGLSSMGRAQKKALKILHGFTDSIISERKRYHESTGRKYLQNFETMDGKLEADKDDTTSIRKRRLAMLDLMIAASFDNQIDDKGIREEVDTFTFEGHDTTASALSFALLLLAKHKDVQERVRKEVNAVMLENDNKLTMQSLQQLTYMERCLKESLRLYPSVPFIARRLEHDCQLTKYKIPADTTINIHIYDVHRDPAFWPNPLVFDPDRFLPENIKGRHPYSYIPFSAGPRNCIGQKFVMLEMKLMVAYILRSFLLEPVDEIDDVKMKTDLVLRPSHPILMKVIPL